jgi:L-lactate utilization protein LutB
MEEVEKERFRKSASEIIDSLKKKQYEPYFFEKAEEARNFIQNQIDPQETVGVSGSITLREGLRIVDGLEEKGIVFYDVWDTGGDPARAIELKRKQRGVDVVLSSVNAITRNGIMVYLDGGGNRVASICSGPKKIIVATGVNKIVDSVDLAISRTQQNAAVLNAIRLKRKTPCVETGICSDCSSPERICAALLILYKRPTDIDRFTVVIVNEDLGY